MHRIAIFASGKGSNADNLCRYFENHPVIRISLIITDRKEAGVLDVAEKHGIEHLYFNKAAWLQPQLIIDDLQKRSIDFIVLAGFLKLVPPAVIHAYNRRIINIHPALLPKFGGRGMFGMHVHEAVANAKEKETGITIHYVNEQYDKGDVIFQARVSLTENDTPETIAIKVHELEMKHFPVEAERLLSKKE